jgi:hypothetical protein
LLKANIDVDLLVYDTSECLQDEHGLRYLAMADEWRPWIADSSGDATYPPIIECTSNETSVNKTAPTHHELLDYITSASAIVSKPGGATLVESLTTATPIVFLSAYGEHERINARMWETFGFGVSVERWIAEGMSITSLESLRRNLDLIRQSVPSYPDDLAARIETGGRCFA